MGKVGYGKVRAQHPLLFLQERGGGGLPIGSQRSTKHKIRWVACGHRAVGYSCLKLGPALGHLCSGAAWQVWVPVGGTAHRVMVGEA